MISGKRFAMLGGVVLAAALLVVLFMVPTAEPPPPPPSPNTYTNLVALAGQLRAETEFSQESQGLTEDGLPRLVAANAPLLIRAREALTQPVAAPTVYTMAYLQMHTADVGQLKRLAQSFRHEGQLAEQEKRWAEAADSYLQAVDLGVAISQNGLMIDRLLGVSCEAIGLQRLEKMVEHLTPVERERVAAQLAEFGERVPSVEGVIAREHYLMRWLGPGFMRFVNTLMARFQPSSRQVYQVFRGKCDKLELMRAQVIAALRGDPVPNSGSAAPEE